MKTRRLIFLCIVIIIAVIVVVVKVGNRPSDVQNTLPVQSAKNLLVPQANSEGSVSIIVTPKVLEKGKTGQFEISFTTHSGSLDFDLLQVAKLVDDEGNNYKPVSWSGGKGGHHLEGALSFSPILEKATKVTLTLFKIDGTDRVFSWEL